MSKGIKNLTKALEAVAALNKAKTVEDSDVKVIVDQKIKTAAENNKNVDAIIAGLEKTGMTEDSITLMLGKMGLVKVDLDAERKRLTAEVKAELESQKSEALYSGLGEIAMLAELFADDPQPSYAPAPPQIVVVPEAPTIPQQITPQTTATPAPTSQWEKHCNVTYDARSERYKVEQQFKNGEIDFPTYIKLKASINMQAFANHADVTAKKNRR